MLSHINFLNKTDIQSANMGVMNVFVIMDLLNFILYQQESIGMLRTSLNIALQIGNFMSPSNIRI